MRRLRNGITALLLFVVTCSVAACGAPTSGGQSPTVTSNVQPTVQIVTPTANQELDANSGGVIAVPLDATATGDGPLTFSWSDTLSLIGGYKSNQIIFAQPPTSFPCGPQPDTLTTKVADVHNQSVSAQVDISLQRAPCAGTPPPGPPTATPHTNPPPAPTATNPPPPTVQIITPSANATLTKTGGAIDVPLDAAATGNGPLTFSWSDTLSLIGGYRGNQIIFAQPPTSFPCGPQPDTLKVTVKDSHGQSASASELIYLQAC